MYQKIYQKNIIIKLDYVFKVSLPILTDELTTPFESSKER